MIAKRDSEVFPTTNAHVMRSILVRFLGPTGTKGRRVKAFASGPDGASVTIGYRHEETPENNARIAAGKVISAAGWSGFQYTLGHVGIRGLDYVLTARAPRLEDPEASWLLSIPEATRSRFDRWLLHEQETARLAIFAANGASLEGGSDE